MKIKNYLSAFAIAVVCFIAIVIFFSGIGFLWILKQIFSTVWYAVFPKRKFVNAFGRPVTKQGVCKIELPYYNLNWEEVMS